MAAQHGSIGGRKVHNRPSVSKSKLKTVSRDSLNPSSNIQKEVDFPGQDDGTTILTEEQLSESLEDTKSKKIRPKHVGKVNLTPDTTVLGMDLISGDLLDDEVINEPVPEQENKTEEKPKPATPDNIKEKDLPKEKKETPKKKEIPQRFVLTRLSDGDKVTIDKNKFVVGKSKFSDYQVFRTKTVSRTHAIFTIENDKIFVEDNNSTNGTSVDGIYLSAHQKTELKDGAVIKLSDEDFKLSILDN